MALNTPFFKQRKNFLFKIDGCIICPYRNNGKKKSQADPGFHNKIYKIRSTKRQGYDHANKIKKLKKF